MLSRVSFFNLQRTNILLLICTIFHDWGFWWALIRASGGVHVKTFYTYCRRLGEIVQKWTPTGDCRTFKFRWWIVMIRYSCSSILWSYQFVVNRQLAKTRIGLVCINSSGRLCVMVCPLLNGVGMATNLPSLWRIAGVSLRAHNWKDWAVTRSVHAHFLTRIFFKFVNTWLNLCIHLMNLILRSSVEVAMLCSNVATPLFLSWPGERARPARGLLHGEAQCCGIGL